MSFYHIGRKEASSVTFLAFADLRHVMSSNIAHRTYCGVRTYRPMQTFNVGSGLTDSLRHKPPQIGSIITYRFQELTRDGVPRYVFCSDVHSAYAMYCATDIRLRYRFPSYIGVAIDKDEPKDAEIPEHRKAGASAADA